MDYNIFPFLSHNLAIVFAGDYSSSYLV